MGNLFGFCLGNWVLGKFGVVLFIVVFVLIVIFGVINVEVFGFGELDYCFDCEEEF